MFLYGDQIVNDYNSSTLLNHLISIKAVRGKDYIYYDKDKIILKPTPKIIASPLCYQHSIVNVSYFNQNIGRTINHTKRIIQDCVYDTSLKHMKSCSYQPNTLGWTFDHNYSSVIHYIMKLIEGIPNNKRNDKKYVITYMCSKIDACNDPINGIIEGRWKSTFTGGIPPSSWKNSSHIFSERIRQKTPVKYGQCWVLADILTGIFIFMGLKARSVKIKNSIMDIYDTYGVDYFQSTNDIALKSHGKTFNPMAMIPNTRDSSSVTVDYNADIETTPEPIYPVEKGPIFSLRDEVEVSDKDLYDLNYFLERQENRKWNFHVWTEVKVDESWYILDPCPIHDVHPDFKPYKDYRKDFDSSNGLKFFGPISINSIRNHRIPNDLVYNFRYLFACVNGQMRYWSPLVIENANSLQKSKHIMYLNQVKTNEPQIYERLYTGELINVTSRYRNSYEGFHHYHPMYMQIKNNDITKIFLHTHSRYISNFIVQFALFYGNTPLYIHRERMSNLNPENLSFLRCPSIRNYRLKATKLTFCVYDTSNNLFWNQCIQK